MKLFNILLLSIFLIHGTSVVQASDINYETYGYEIANNISFFINTVINDTLFVGNFDYSDITTTKEKISQFSESKKKEIWYNIGSDLVPIEQKKTIPLYSEITFIDKYGNEIIKYKGNSFSNTLTDVSKPENTEYKSETYFNDTKDLPNGIIHIGKIKTWYTKKDFIFKDYKKDYYEQYERVIARDILKEGILRFSTPIYRNNQFQGIVVLSLNYKHIQELTKHINPASRQPVISTSYSSNYILFFDNDGNTIVHPKPDNVLGYLPNGTLAGYNEKNPKTEGNIFNLYKYHLSNTYNSIATSVLKRKTVFTSSAKDVSNRTKLIVAVPIKLNNPNTTLYNRDIFGGIMLSINLEEEKESLGELSIKLKALQVSNQINNYIKSNPKMTISDLQNDPFFQSLAIQNVGKTGYTSIIDKKSHIIKFHKYDEFVNFNLSNAKDNLPEMYSMITRMNFEDDVYGFYEWIEPDGTRTNKYQYLSAIESKTADGVQLIVSASTYLKEFEIDITPDLTNEEIFAKNFIKQKVLSVSKEIQFFLQSNRQKNISDLQNDPFFNTIAIQKISPSSTTEIFNYNNFNLLFHKNKSLINTNILNTSKNSELKKFIINSQYGKRNSEGLIEIRDSLGNIKKKYVYISIITEPIQNIGIAILASEFLENINTTTTQPKSETLEELSIKLKALQIKNEIEEYMVKNPKTLSELQKDQNFNQIAVQKIGKTGYSAVVNSENGIIYFHQNKELINQPILNLLEKFSKLKTMILSTIGSQCKDTSGYYDFSDEKGEYKEKYAYQACIDIPTSDGIKFYITATTYVEEFSSKQEKKTTLFIFAQDNIKKKAISIGKQIELYLKNNPQKTLLDLQKDTFFNDIAVQAVGKTGYSYLITHQTGEINFHPDPKIRNTSYDSFKYRFPTIWNIIDKSIQSKNCEDSFGFYEWADISGSLRNKYTYHSCINGKTSDGYSFFVGASTYLDEYKEESLIIENPIVQEINFDIKNLIINIIALLMYTFLYFSIVETKHKKRKGYFRHILISGFLINICHILISNTTNQTLLLVSYRILILSIFSFTFFYTILCHLIIKKKINNFIIMPFYLAIAYITLFTKLIINNTAFIDNIPRALYGNYFQLYMIFPVFLLAYIFYSFYKSKIDTIKPFKIITGIFILISFAMILLQVTNFAPSFTETFANSTPFIISILLSYALYKKKFLIQKHNISVLLLLLTILVIIFLFILNAYQISEQIKSQAIDSFRKQQLNLAKQSSQKITDLFKSIENEISISTENIDFLSETPNARYEHLNKMYKRLEQGVDSIYLINSSGFVLARSPSLFFYENNNQNYSNKPGIQAAILSHKSTISDLFQTEHNNTALSHIYPIKNTFFEGLLRTNINFADLIKRNFYSFDFSENTAYFMINNSIYFIENDQIKKRENKYNILFKEPSSKEIVEKNVNKLLAFFPIDIPDKNWGIVLVAPSNSAYSSVSSSVNKIWFYTIGLIISVIIVGIIFNFLFTKSLRREIDGKTEELKNFNIQLEEVVKERTEELNKKSKQVTKLNLNLESEINKKTSEIEEKLEKEAKTTKAMIYILERAKRTNVELNSSKKDLAQKNIELSNQSSKLAHINADLISTQKELEKEKTSVEKKVEIRTKSLMEANTQIHELLKQKDIFIGQVAHDLKTPLTPVLGYLQLLQYKNKDKSLDRYLNEALNNISFLKSLLNDILTLAKLNSKEGKLNLRRENIEKIIKETVKSHDIVMKKKGIKITFEIEKTPGILIDKIKIMEVINNFISNAYKFLQKTPKLTFIVKNLKTHIEITIKDNGIGMTKETINKIFNEFYKADESRHHLSAGLGLSICKRIIEQHQGKIRAESPGLGKGSSFIFTLPIL